MGGGFFGTLRGEGGLNFSKLYFIRHMIKIRVQILPSREYTELDWRRLLRRGGDCDHRRGLFGRLHLLLLLRSPHSFDRENESPGVVPLDRIYAERVIFNFDRFPHSQLEISFSSEMDPTIMLMDTANNVVKMKFLFNFFGGVGGR